MSVGADRPDRPERPDEPAQPERDAAMEQLTSLADGGIAGDPIPDDWGDVSRFRSLFAQSPVASWIVDLDRQRIFANQATGDLFHIAADEQSLTDALSLLHPDELNRTRKEVLALLTGELDRVSRVKHFNRPDGSNFWGHLDSTALVDRKGRRFAILSICRDVTRQREAERALSEREAWFEALVRNNVDAIIVLDEIGRLTYASPSAENLAGRPITARLGLDALELVHDNDREIVTESFFNTASVPGTAVPLQFRITRPDGDSRMVEAVATNLLDDPAVRGIVVNLRDLTETEEVANALVVSENRFRKMLENISDTVTLLDHEGQVLGTTGNVKQILGYPTEFWSVRNAFDIAHPDDLDIIRRMFVELLESPGGELTGEFRVRHAEGRYEFIEASAVNLLEDGDVNAIVVTTRNITESKQTQQALSEARDHALWALDVRNEFVASVSHELRTPIHGILGLTELLATSAGASDELVQLALSIRRATESLRLVLDDILDFTKIEAGRLELTEAPVSLPELVDDLETLFGPQARSKNIELELVVDERLPSSFLSDGLRLRQVLNNLLSNAIKFTTVGGVTVTMAPGVDRSGDRLRIEVVDTGIGMSAEVITRVFEPFSQAHASTAREYGGTGLGLTIARRLVSMMDGTLGVQSEVGKGTRFSVELPLQIRAAGYEPRREPTDVDAASVGTRRVLVVEDNAVNQLLVGRQLERLGYEPVVVGSGEAAVEASRDATFDAVLMDWQMPGMDGLEATRLLRAIESDLGRDRVPIVAMTASAMPGDRERCLAAGMDDFVAKPVNLATLGRVLATWLYPAEAEDGDGAGPEPVDPSAPTMDGDVLDRLCEELDDASLVVTVVATYRRELPGRVSGIEDAARSSDYEELGAIAHTLKSTSAAIGAERLAALCLELEQLARGGSGGPSLEPLLAQIVAERDRVELALVDEVARFGDGSPAVVES
jgi:PAS domain S-box-containing protein